MARIPSTRRIISEDFAEEYAGLVSKLGYVLNAHMDDVTFAINGGLDFENSVSNITSATITLGADNKPVSTSQIRTDLSSASGLQVINAVNLTNNQIYPTSQPFISFTNNGNGLVTIDNITGLPQGYKFQLTIIAY